MTNYSIFRYLFLDRYDVIICMQKGIIKQLKHYG